MGCGAATTRTRGRQGDLQPVKKAMMQSREVYLQKKVKQLEGFFAQCKIGLNSVTAIIASLSYDCQDISSGHNAGEVDALRDAVNKILQLNVATRDLVEALLTLITDLSSHLSSLEKRYGRYETTSSRRFLGLLTRMSGESLIKASSKESELVSDLLFVGLGVFRYSAVLPTDPAVGTQF